MRIINLAKDVKHLNYIKYGVKNLNLIFFFLLFHSTNLFAQEYYSFSDKENGKFSDGGKFIISGTIGTGISIKSSNCFSAEYEFKNASGSIGINYLSQSYKDETLFEFQSKLKNRSVNFFVKKIIYSNSGKLAFFGSLGIGKTIENKSKTYPISYFFDAGLKYKFANKVGGLFNFYTTGEFDIAGGIGLYLTF